MQDALRYVDAHLDRFVEDLDAFLRIPSVSTDPAHAGDVRRCAEWLAGRLREIGVADVELVETDGHPVVLAEHHVGDDRPTVLVYGHYDVQPPDPLDEWTTPPFEPTHRDGKVYARGASDDKGQAYMHVAAAEAYLKGANGPPVNLKFVIEGEEESGSANLEAFLESHRDRLAADVCVISDTSLFGDGIPSITSGLRGMSYCEVTLRGPDRDLHSGVYGGAVHNPINALARLISGLHTPEHAVAVPGFYDDVRPLTDDERAAFRALPFDAEAWKASVGVADVRREEGYSILEAITARPTLDCNGIWGGYTGAGAKTVLPSKASAKISMRLVPDQDPVDVADKLRAYFEAHTPETMQLTFRYLHGGDPSVVPTDSPAMQAAADAMEGAFGQKPHFTREGGSIPVVADLKRLLGLNTVLMGFGLNSDAIHSPNEHFGLDRFELGIRTIVRFLDAYGGR